MYVLVCYPAASGSDLTRFTFFVLRYELSLGERSLDPVLRVAAWSLNDSWPNKLAGYIYIYIKHHTGHKLSTNSILSKVDTVTSPAPQLPLPRPPSTPVLAQPVHMVCLQTGLLCGALAKRWPWWRNAGCETQTKGARLHAKHVCFGWVSWGLEMAQGIVATHQKLQSKSYLSLLFCKHESWRFTEPRLNVTIFSEHRLICFFFDNTTSPCPADI